MTRALALAISIACLAAPAYAQTSDAAYDRLLSKSIAAGTKATHRAIRQNLADAAEAMPAEEYGYRPAPESRSFGQLIGHVVMANYLFCSQAQGKTPDSTPALTINYEKETSKAVLVKALNDALAYCDAAYDATTDATFGEPVHMAPLGTLKAIDTTRGALLIYNTTHNNEHYGNIVVYMRVKGHVPPSTARARQQQNR